MADAAVQRRSALAECYETGRFGTVFEGDAPIQIEERRGLAIIQVGAWADHVSECVKAVEAATGVAPPTTPVSAATAGTVSALWVQPDRWLIVEPEHRDLYQTLRTMVPADMGAVVDLSHSRVCFSVSGARVRDLLAHGATIDFDPGKFEPSACVGTSLGHMTATVHMTGPDAVDIYAMRSYARSFFEWLTHTASEWGYEVV